MKNLLLILSLSSMLLYCSQPNKTEEQVEKKPLLDQVLEVHDEVMPKMGDLEKTKRLLVGKADSIAALQPELADSLNALAQDIALANEAMMDWMRNFDPTYSASEEEVKDYLLKKKKGIETVAKMMNEKLAEGQEALKD